MIEKLLSTLFGKPEEINGRGRCPTYLYRWTLWHQGNGRALMVHKFVGGDWSRDLHDHPKRFISIGLKGWYRETYLDVEVRGGERCFDQHERVYRAPWFRSFPAHHTHRLDGPTPEAPCWTLVLVSPYQRAWGFRVGTRWVGWREYVGSEQADFAKNCN